MSRFLWRGWAPLVVPLALACWIATWLAAVNLWGMPLSADKRQGAEAAGMALAALLAWGLHRLLQRLQPGRPQDFLFLQLRWWPVPLLALGLLFWLAE